MFEVVFCLCICIVLLRCWQRLLFIFDHISNGIYIRVDISWRVYQTKIVRDDDYDGDDRPRWQWCTVALRHVLPRDRDIATSLHGAFSRSLLFVPARKSVLRKLIKKWKWTNNKENAVFTLRCRVGHSLMRFFHFYFLHISLVARTLRDNGRRSAARLRWMNARRHKKTHLYFLRDATERRSKDCALDGGKTNRAFSRLTRSRNKTTLPPHFASL